MANLIPVERIENKIYFIRGQKVMLDFDLAKLYGVKTSALNQAVKMNKERFPGDFMFPLTRDETMRMSQIVTSSGSLSSIKYHKNINAFTENGVAMLSSVIRSRFAFQVNILIMRTFTRLRMLLASHKDLADKIRKLEQKFGKHDAEIQQLFAFIQKLLTPPAEKPPKRIGFRVS